MSGFLGSGQFRMMTSGFTGQVKNVEINVAGRGVQEITTLADEARKFGPITLTDAGEINLDLLFDADDLPPVNEDPEGCQVKWDECIIAAQGFCQQYQSQITSGDLQRATMSIKLSGPLLIIGRRPIDNLEGQYIKNLDNNYIYGG